MAEEYDQSLLKEEGESHQAVFASIDKTGNKIEVRLNNNIANYLIRCDTP